MRYAHDAWPKYTGVETIRASASRMSSRTGVSSSSWMQLPRDLQASQAMHPRMRILAMR